MKKRERDEAPLLRAALEYAARGWKVFPLNGKRPFPNTHGHLDATTDTARIRSWWREYPTANIGIACSSDAGPIVLDVDGQDGDEAIADLGIPLTLEARSRKGRRHYYFSPCGTAIKRSIKVRPGLDLLGDNGYVVAPPSIHPKTGKPYRWLNDLDLAPFPKSLVKQLVKSNGNGSAPPLPNSIGEGERDDALTSLAGSMRRRGASEQAILAALLEENRTRCNPPLNEAQVKKIARSIGKKKPEMSRREARQADLLLDELETAEVELFHTPNHEGWITIGPDNFPLSSDAAHDWLARLSYQKSGRAPSKTTLEDVIAVLTARARFDGPEHRIHMRVAPGHLDIGDAERTVVSFSPRAWHVTSNDESRPRFVRTPSMQKHAVPAPTERSVDELLSPFLNVASDSDLRLIITTVVKALLADSGPCPILVLTGEQGSAKSTTARVLVACIDPSVLATRQKPRNVDDLFVALENNHLVSIDNSSGIEPWLADALCTISTGGALAKRRHYKNKEQVFIDLPEGRPVIVNGIDDQMGREDFADRCVVITLPPISDDQRRDERTFWKQFEEVRPELMGALLNLVVGALRELPTVRKERIPVSRMADFCQIGIAVERAAGWPEGSFLTAYNDNKAEIASEAFEASPIARHIKAIVKRANGRWKGTLSQLVDEIEHRLRAEGHVPPWRYNTKPARWLSNELKRLKPILRRERISVGERQRSHGKRLYVLEAI